MAAELDGPRLAPRSGSARQLVVFLHGYGADGLRHGGAFLARRFAAIR